MLVGSPNYESECHQIIKHSNAVGIHNYFESILNNQHSLKNCHLQRHMFVKLMVICETLLLGKFLSSLKFTVRCTWLSFSFSFFRFIYFPLIQHSLTTAFSIFTLPSSLPQLSPPLQIYCSSIFIIRLHLVEKFNI